MKGLTATSYAVLGLLAVKPTSSYELAKQVSRGLRFVWPRAEGRIYDEPKLLVEYGYARAKVEHTGRRARTVYSITPRGSRALRRWLAEPGAGLRLEYEALVKVSHATRGDRSDLVAQLAVVQRQVEEVLAVGRARAHEHGNGLVPLPENLAVNALMWRFLWEVHSAIESWADWAQAEVASWPDDLGPTPGMVERARAMLREVPAPGAGTSDGNMAG